MNSFYRFRGAFVLAVLVMLTAVTGLAQNDTGLNVRIESDKTAYSKDEMAKLTITVENMTDCIAADVNIENLLPNGLVYADKANQGQYRHSEIAPHSSVTHEVYVKLVDTATPQTGDRSPDVCLLLACALACVLLMSLLRVRSAAAKK